MRIKFNKEIEFFFKKIFFSQSYLLKKRLERSIKNIPNVKVTDVNHFSAFDVIKFKKIIFNETSIKELEKRYL